MHPDGELMKTASERYKERYDATYGHKAGETSTLVDDYKLFGDILDPRVLNSWNSDVVTRYTEVYVDRTAEHVTKRRVNFDTALEILLPVMTGMFEHVFLMGVMFEQERQKARDRA